MRRSRRSRRSSRHSGESSPRHNPPLLTDLAEFIGPGFAGFAAARFGTYLAATQVAKRKPTWGKHAGAVAAIGAFFAAWYLASKWKAISRWQTPIIVGAGIAALQSILQLYFPRLGWMVSDASPQLASQSAQQQAIAARPVQAELPPDMTATDDDPANFVYDDRYDAGRMSGGSIQADATDPVQQGAQPNVGVGDDDLSDLNLDDLSQQMGGVFAG